MFQPDAPDAAAIDARLSCRARVESLLAFLQHQRAGLLARQEALQAQLSQFGLHTPEAVRRACEGLSASAVSSRWSCTTRPWPPPQAKANACSSSCCRSCR